MTELRFLTTPEDEGRRIDTVLRDRWPDASRRYLRELFLEGRIRLDGQIARKASLVSRGQVICVAHADRTPPKPAELDVVFVRDDVLVVNKPAGTPTAPRPFDPKPCLSDAVLARYPAMRGLGYRPDEAGLLSRLDTDTSGLVLCARTAAAFDELRAGAATGVLVKHYQALVAGPCALRAGDVFDAPLGPHAKNRRKVASSDMVRGRARPAQTLVVSVARASSRVALVVLQVHTAYRHQVRFHLARAGHPILGDSLYGGPHWQGLQRHALHAHRLAWPGGENVARFDVVAELPAELIGCLTPD